MTPLCGLAVANISSWSCLTAQLQLLTLLMNKSFGISGSTLIWLSSYLSNRKFEGTGILCGVPQGSILGPILFSQITCSCNFRLRKKTWAMLLPSLSLFSSLVRTSFVSEVKACISSRLKKLWFGF